MSIPPEHPTSRMRSFGVGCFEQAGWTGHLNRPDVRYPQCNTASRTENGLIDLFSPFGSLTAWVILVSELLPVHHGWPHVRGWGRGGQRACFVRIVPRWRRCCRRGGLTRTGGKSTPNRGFVCLVNTSKAVNFKHLLIPLHGSKSIDFFQWNNAHSLSNAFFNLSLEVMCSCLYCSYPETSFGDVEKWKASKGVGCGTRLRAHGHQDPKSKIHAPFTWRPSCEKCHLWTDHAACPFHA